MSRPERFLLFVLHSNCKMLSYRLSTTRLQLTIIDEARQKNVKIRKELDIEDPTLEKRLEAARIAKGMSVSALCRTAGISRDYWYDIISEAFQGYVSEATFRKIEAALGVDFGVKFD